MAQARNTNGMAIGQLRAFVERIERLDEEAKTLNNDRKEVYAEAKMTGFDTKAMKVVIAKRRMESADREEQEEIVNLYWDSLHGEASNSDLEAKVRPPAPAHAPEAAPPSSPVQPPAEKTEAPTKPAPAQPEPDDGLDFLAEE